MLYEITVKLEGVEPFKVRKDFSFEGSEAAVLSEMCSCIDERFYLKNGIIKVKTGIKPRDSERLILSSSVFSEDELLFQTETNNFLSKMSVFFRTDSTRVKDILPKESVLEIGKEFGFLHSVKFTWSEKRVPETIFKIYPSHIFESGRMTVTTETNPRIEIQDEVA